MAFRSTSLSELNRVKTLSIDDKQAVKVSKAKAPAVKPTVRNHGSSGITTASRPMTDAAAPTQNLTRRKTNTVPSLTIKWFDEVEQANPLPLRLPRVDRRSRKASRSNESSKNTFLGGPPRQSEPLTRSDSSSPYSTYYDQTLLPSFLRTTDEEDEDEDAPALKNAWRNPHSYQTTPPPPPPSQTGNRAWERPFALEPLGPLRQHATQDYIPVPPRLPYAAVARHGVKLPRLPDLPKLDETPQISYTEKPEYETLIRREANLRKDAASAEGHLRQMIVDFYAGVNNQAPDGCCYNMVLHAYAVEGNPEQAENILKLMWEDYERGNKNALPNQRCYTSCMYAWQKVTNNKSYAPEACEKILREMYRLHDSGVNPECKPDLFAYTCILHCWADSRRKDAIQRAITLFRQMLVRCEKGEKDLMPDNVCYSNLINVYIYAAAEENNNFEMVEKAAELFWEMLNSFFNGNAKAEPTTRNFNTILAALSKAKSNKAAEMAHRMMTKWERFFDEGHVGAKPDAFSYSLLLKTWASSPRQDAMKMLETTVEHMRNVGHKLNASAKLDAIKYGTIITALAKNGHVRKAHDMLLEMCSVYQNGGEKSRDTKPDLKCFELVMSAWTRQSDVTYAATKAKELLDRLSSLKKYNSSIKPSTAIYNSALSCFKNAKQAKTAHNLLEDMKERGKKPDVTSYRIVLEAWHRSDDDSKPLMIRTLTNEYKKRFGTRPPN
eukprot:scaffold1569_cov171-Amphora_coffeaeformis.AAC.24